MFTHNSLIEACRNLGLDPEKKGGNSMMNGHPCNTFPKPFDLKGINFPEKELFEVVEIGKIIWNLSSQINCFHYYDATQQGREDSLRDKSVQKLMPILEDSQNYWLKMGLEKCKSTKNLVTHNGDIFEVDPEYQKSMNKFNEEMEKIIEDGRRMQNASWQSAKDIILD